MGAIHGGGKNRITPSYGKAILYATGQTTQYSSELDDGYYQFGESKKYLVLSTLQFSGTVNIDLIHLVSDTGAFTVADQTYTDAGKCEVFLAGGGETIVITGSASNNGTFTTVSATANTVVVTAGFVNEADAPETTFKKREVHSNNCVLDLNSRKGLMFSRYVSDKMGTAGAGKMPWTGQTYDIFAYCAAANVAGLGGYSNWRIPNIDEICLIRIHEPPNAYPDAIAFPGWAVPQLWTSTTRENAVTQALIPYFNYGGSDGSVKTTNYCVLLVRGGG